MDLNEFCCPQCKEALDHCKPVGGKVFGICKACCIVIVIEDLETWRRRMNSLKIQTNAHYGSYAYPPLIVKGPLGKPFGKKEFNPSRRE